MQKAVCAVGAPVAAVERIPTDQIERARYRLAILLGHYQQHPICHGFAQHQEELAGEIRAAPFALAGVDIEAEEILPVARVEIGAGEALDDQAVAQRCLALLADHLALTRRKTREKIGEGFIALVTPMVLRADTLHQ